MAIQKFFQGGGIGSGGEIVVGAYPIPPTHWTRSGGGGASKASQRGPGWPQPQNYFWTFYTQFCAIFHAVYCILKLAVKV